MRYFAIIGDEGYIYIRGFESESRILNHSDWREVHDISEHCNEIGQVKLDAGRSVCFTERDQSFHQLAGLFE